MVFDLSGNGDRVVTTKYMVRSADAATSDSTITNVLGSNASTGRSGLERRGKMQHHQSPTDQQQQHSLRWQPVGGHANGRLNAQSERRPSTAGPAVRVPASGSGSISTAADSSCTSVIDQIESRHGQRQGHHTQPPTGAPKVLLGHSGLVRGGSGACGNRDLGPAPGALRDRLLQRGAQNSSGSRAKHGVAVLAGRGPGTRGTAATPSGAWLVPSQTSLLAANPA